MGWIVGLLILIIIGLLAYIFFLPKRIKKVAINEMEGRRTAFISIISHQLRTPLSVIKGFLEALSTGDQGELNQGQKEYLNDALKINKETINLVNDYLDAVRLDSDEMPVNPESLDLVKMAEEEVKKLVLLAKAYNCELVFKEPDQSLSQVAADKVKIRQVIENIIANAIKYTSGKGQAIITLEEDNGGVVFHCRDNGVGIPADQQDEIFTKFFRAKNVINKDTKGSGLGLYLARMIVKALGGRIWLNSKEGRGTTVSFRLPKYTN